MIEGTEGVGQIIDIFTSQSASRSGGGWLVGKSFVVDLHVAVTDLIVLVRPSVVVARVVGGLKKEKKNWKTVTKVEKKYKKSRPHVSFHFRFCILEKKH